MRSRHRASRLRRLVGISTDEPQCLLRVKQSGFSNSNDVGLARAVIPVRELSTGEMG